MDMTTLLGVIGVAGVVVLGALSGGDANVFLNPHGLALVCGGTAIALLINTPWELIREAARSVFLVLRGPRQRLPQIITVLIAMSQDVHTRGINALRSTDARAADGFVARAAQAALEFNDPAHVAQVLENEINQGMDRDNEVVNVFRTMGVLAPMFGLLGTLIGIIGVLRELSNPEQVGASMATAITTAFYGILLANLVAVPLAGKLRIRYWEKYMMQRVIIEAITMMMKGTVPAVLERRLRAYLQQTWQA